MSFNNMTRESDSVQNTVLDKIASISYSELEDFITSPSSTMELEKAQHNSDLVMTYFFTRYSAEDYVWIRNSFYKYIKFGGHDSYNVVSLATSHNSDLNVIFASICAYADQMAPQQFWDESVMSLDGVYQISDCVFGTPEYECRVALRNSIAFMSIENGAELGLDILGLTIPGIEELTMLADLVGAGAAVIEYYACIHRAIT